MGPTCSPVQCVTIGTYFYNLIAYSHHVASIAEDFLQTVKQNLI